MEVKRRIMVERVARELFENLLFTGSDTPMVKMVQQALQEAFGEPILFQYPPGSLDLIILREGPAGPVEVTPMEKEVILDKAWQVTLDKVDDTML